MIGRVKVINMEKKWGFITCEENEKDYFFHITGCANKCFEDLRQGDTVSFEVSHDPRKGDRAVEVELA